MEDAKRKNVDGNAVAKKRKVTLINSGVTKGLLDSALDALECGGYDSGCCCIKCINKWRYNEPWKRKPRCIMCPGMCNESGLEYDGVCGAECKRSLCELMHGRMSEGDLPTYVYEGKISDVKSGYPFNNVNGNGIFKKTEWAKRRKDLV